MRRHVYLAFLLVMIVAVIPALASATPKDSDGNHKVTICHVTNSAKNPYVIITVDVAAFDGGEKSDHKHHVSKDGRRDVEVVDGVCPGVNGTTTTTTSTTTTSTTTSTTTTTTTTTTSSTTTTTTTEPPIIG